MAADQVTGQALVGLDNLELGPGAAENRWSGLARRSWNAGWPKVLAVILVLVVWQIVHLTGWKDLVLKGPGTVLSSLWQMAHHALLWDAIGVTMRRALTGYVVALIIGTLAGLLVARIPPLRAALGSIITGLQTMPSIAWFPFAIILFAQGTDALIFVMVMGAAPSIANGLITGVDYTPPLLLRAGRTMGLHGLALYWYLILPASLPAFVAGLKQGWAFAWRSLMAGEIVVSFVGAPGLGVLLNTDQSQLDFTGATTIIITILILGIVIDMFFTKADLALRRRRGLLDPAAAS
jgi:NitT/TauT family transport system permease protein